MDAQPYSRLYMKRNKKKTFCRKKVTKSKKKKTKQNKT